MGTLDYYNNNAQNYYNSTVNADMTKQYELFLKYMIKNGKILDFGCGSGRDIKYFMNLGYVVIGIDGSIELCKLASEYTKTKIINMDFIDFNEIDTYDGIWASASLLHLNKKDLKKVLINLRNSLKKEGILYISIKDGSDEEIDNVGRYYNYINKDDFELLIDSIELELIDYVCSKSVTNDLETRNWNNFILRRKNGTI